MGDLHVPVLVTYALSGTTDGDDNSMLELLNSPTPATEA